MTKNGALSNCFSVQGTVGIPTDPDPENRVGDQDTGSPGKPVCSGLQVPGEPGYCKNKTPMVTFPGPAFLHQNVLQFHQEK